jgi:hypothetical protein
VEPDLGVVVNLVVGETPVDLLERHPTLEAGKRCTKAEMGAVAERQVPFRAAMQVELLGGRPELPFVVVGGAYQEQH